MPFLVGVMKPINVPPPCCQLVIALSNIEHLTRELGKIGILQKLLLKVVVGLLLKLAPRGNDFVQDIKDIVQVFVN